MPILWTWKDKKLCIRWILWSKMHISCRFTQTFLSHFRNRDRVHVFFRRCVVNIFKKINICRIFSLTIIFYILLFIIGGFKLGSMKDVCTVRYPCKKVLKKDTSTKDTVFNKMGIGNSIHTFSRVTCFKRDVLKGQ